MNDRGQGHWSKVTTVSLLWGGMMVSYMIRLCLGVVAPILMREYHLSAKTMGYILSGWNWSYTGALLIVGPTVDRFGPWIVMGVGSAIWGLSTVALPIRAAAVPLFLMRFLFGFGHSPLVPANATAISRIFDYKERTRAVATSFSGNQVGLAAGATVAAAILARHRWPAVFYCIGGISLLWTLAWFLFYPHKRIGMETEVGNREQGTGNRQQRVPWIALFRYRSTWGIALGQFGYLYANYFFISWLPGYLVLERKMTVLKSGFIASLPFWVGMLGTLGGGWLGDYLIKRGVRPTVCRKGIIGVGLTLSTVTVIAAAFTQQSWLAVTLLTLCVGSLRMATGSVNSLPIDLAPKSVVGSLTSIQNFFGNIGGLLAPIITGYIVSATGSFVNSLVVAGGITLFGAICYVFVMGNIETHPIQPRTATPALGLPLSKPL